MLFRLPENIEDIQASVMAIAAPLYEIMNALKYENLTQSDLLYIQNEISKGNPIYSRYVVRNGFLHQQEKPRLNEQSVMKQELIKEFQATTMRGHSGRLKTFMRVNKFHLATHEGHSEYVEQCHICQPIKYTTQEPAGLLQSLPIL